MLSMCINGAACELNKAKLLPYDLYFQFTVRLRRKKKFSRLDQSQKRITETN